MSVTPHTREVNRCTVTVNSLPEIKKCNYTDDFEADWEGMFQERERAFPLSCKARVDKEVDESVKITASLEEEGQGNNAYCLCSIDHKVSGTTTPSPTSSIKFPLNLTCIISETGVSIHWTGLLEWNTGLDYWNDLCPFL